MKKIGRKDFLKNGFRFGDATQKKAKKSRKKTKERTTEDHKGLIPPVGGGRATSARGGGSTKKYRTIEVVSVGLLTGRGFGKVLFTRRGRRCGSGWGIKGVSGRWKGVVGKKHRLEKDI